MAALTTVVTDSAEEAGECIRQGGLVAFPTETVFGLGADANNPRAVDRLFKVKGRPRDNPAIVHLADIAQIDDLIAPVTVCARKLIRQYFPGPLTIVGTSTGTIAAQVTAGLPSVAVRVPDHETAHAFLQACKRPIAAPSANLSGTTSTTSWRQVVAALDGKVECILRGRRSALGLESTVVDCTTEIPVLLRAGFITLEELQATCPEIEGAADDHQAKRSPGTRHRHYAPDARVIAVASPGQATPSPTSAYIGMDSEAARAGFGRVVVCPDLQTYAFELYEFFHACDKVGIQTIYCEIPVETGIGLALADRVRRASAE